MAHLHIDCFSGISGDMFLGALVDAGLPLSVLKRGLQAMKVEGYQIKAKKVLRGSIQATKVDVPIRKGFTKPLSLLTIRRIITSSQLPSVVKSQSLKTFHNLAEAEGAAHGVPVPKVHFHEVGVVDSLIDIVGAFLGCAYLQIETVSAGNVNVGSGTIESAHGTLPVPGPAVANLAKGVPIFAKGPNTELTTPTGISILTALTQDFGTLPPMTPRRIGYGAGTYNPKNWPNVLRVLLTDRSSGPMGSSDDIVEVQTNLDDMNPQIYEPLMDQLFGAGALDVTLTPVIMKRSRPGTLVTVLGSPTIVEDVTQILFQETTTLGVRIHRLHRHVLPRQIQTVRLPKGTIRVKIADLGDGRQKMMPEYQDCKKLADQTGHSTREIMEQTRQALARLHAKQAKKPSRNKR